MLLPFEKSSSLSKLGEEAWSEAVLTRTQKRPRWRQVGSSRRREGVCCRRFQLWLKQNSQMFFWLWLNKPSSYNAPPVFSWILAVHNHISLTQHPLANSLFLFFPILIFEEKIKQFKWIPSIQYPYFLTQVFIHSVCTYMCACMPRCKCMKTGTSQFSSSIIVAFRDQMRVLKLGRMNIYQLIRPTIPSFF